MPDVSIYKNISKYFPSGKFSGNQFSLRTVVVFVLSILNPKDDFVLVMEMLCEMA